MPDFKQRHLQSYPVYLLSEIMPRDSGGTYPRHGHATIMEHQEAQEKNPFIRREDQVQKEREYEIDGGIYERTEERCRSGTGVFPRESFSYLPIVIINSCCYY